VSTEQCRDAARQLIDTLPAVMQAVASEMRRGDSPMPMPHFRTLMLLAHGDSCTLTEVAEKQRVSLPTMSNTISVLVEHGWVERIADENDRRRAELRLTAEGQAAVDRMHDQVEQLLVTRLCELPSADVAQLSAGLTVLLRAFGGGNVHGRLQGGDAA
jgi:DNA-binding MarR family transcriptional regulator